MTDYQDALVLENLDLVNWVIRTRISIPNRPLLTYDDFYAIGCEAICRAALKYQPDKQEEALKRQAEQEEQDRAFCEERNRKAEQMIDLAIRTIRGGGTLKNEPISLYKSRYDSSTYSIVNHLMGRYQVDVPLRTQGWINDKLISVTIENGKCEHLRYMRSKGAQCSQKIFDCMHELILKACSETEE